jgi:hypothetical protein
MWARYAWDPRRDPIDDSQFWTRSLTDNQLPEKAAKLILEAFELSADVLPAIQRLFWVGHDNHTVVTGGLLVAQIENAEGIPFLPLDPVIPVNEYLNASGPLAEPGSITPDSLLGMKIADCEMALAKMDEAIALSAHMHPWILPYRQDTEAMLLTVRFYREKLQAVWHRNRFMENISDISRREDFLGSLHRSVEIYRELTALTTGTYQSLSDVPAVNPVKLEVCPYHWTDLLPLYEEELRIYRNLISEVGGRDFNKPVFEGLEGIWFGDPGLKKPKFRFGANKIAYDWSSDDKKPEGGRNWSVAWFGYIMGPTDGEVTLLAEADQDIRVKVGGRILIDRNVSGGPLEGKIMMVNGQPYELEITYDHANAVAGYVRLTWKIGEQDEEVIKAKYLKHSRADLFRVDRTLIQPGHQTGI